MKARGTTCPRQGGFAARVAGLALQKATGLVCACALGLAGSAWAQPSAAGGNAQQPAKIEEAQRPIRVDVPLVGLYATVRNSKRNIVGNLEKEEFRVFEDGVEQKVEYFSRESQLPITLGMLIDTSISQQAVLGIEQEYGVRFLRGVLRASDLAFVLSFDVNVDLLSDLTSDYGQLERALHRAQINAPVNLGPFESRPRGTSLYDAVYLACREKLVREAGRKALVILTDGVDAGSRKTLEEALETAQRSNTVIYVIGVSDPGYYGGYRSVGSGEAVSKKLAEETGGRAFFVRGEKKLREAFEQISEELRTQYTLGYYSSNHARDGKFRRVKVEVSRKGMRVQARRGYYATVDN